MKKNKSGRKRVQTPKPRNEAWSKAVMDQANRNNTVPSGKRYKRKKAGARGRDW